MAMMRTRTRLAVLAMIVAVVLAWRRAAHRRQQQFAVSPSGTAEPFPFAAIPRPEVHPKSAAGWIEASDRDPPESHPVKVKMSSGIYHVPGGSSYDRTRADRWYRDTATAESDGYRAAKH
jgi:hypothetical protein